MKTGSRTSLALTALLLTALLLTGLSAIRRTMTAGSLPLAAYAGDARFVFTDKAPLPVDKVKVINSYPHDYEAFTEGLLFRDGFLYESTGINGKSGIRRVELETGKVLKKQDLPAQYFGEGLTEWGKTLVQLTWRSGRGFVYNLEDFKVEREFTYSGEGWGITQDGKNIIMSDGTNRLTFLDPDTFTKEKAIEVTAAGKPLKELNELEYVKGEILANIWQRDVVARISPETGKVTGWIDMTELRDRIPAGTRAEVLNGIAYDADRDRLFVTGKYWPRLFQVEILREE